ncbi:unnamed protein product [Arctia plantaginis]|uniref:Metalloendopeptidase n=1 Tax=Arctia plantaginis TaxID=874455 RepID=A0A8S0YRJ5_ARCPL|nr:unnamed protein product [Arctia plantaginis]
MDMCRIFTEETQKLEKINEVKKGHRSKKKGVLKHRRAKRQTGFNALNPTLYLDDARRVENIVDKVYDDLLEKGEKIKYRRMNIEELERNKTITSPVSGRRFVFAPMNLTRGHPTKPGSNMNGPPPPGKTPRFPLSIVPYFIDRRTYDANLADMIGKAFDYVEKVTCIRLQRLRERPTDKESLQNVEWLYITNPSGIRQCVHSNERALIRGVQMIVLGYDCMSVGEILHETMHVLGFSHEHIRPDRDQFVSILWDNIKPGYKKFFERLEEPNVENLPYDYASILHYPSRAFSKNGQVTIVARDGLKIGQRDGLSDTDIEKINTIYSAECVKRNRQYLLKTCPSVVKPKPEPQKASRREIEQYFEKRLWPYGFVNYQIKDSMEFTSDEKENIRAVIHHIEMETCIEFRDLTQDSDSSNESDNSVESNNNSKTNNTITQKSKLSGEIDLNAEDAISNQTNKENTLQADGSKTDKIINKLSKASESNAVEDDKDSLMKSKTYKREKESLTAKGKQLKKKTSKRSAKSTRLGTNGRARPPISPSRRHASNILVFTRSTKPGCACPKIPGVPTDPITIEINADCFNSVNVLLHLFVHLLGLDHQHNSHDRDSFLHIVWDQLTEDVKQEMQDKLPPAASAGFAYDYQSVMHYPWLQIKNGRSNIMYPIWNDGWAMGNWQGLSSVDVQKLNYLYKSQCELRRREAEAAGVKLGITHK